MGVRVLVGTEADARGRKEALLYCSTTGWGFGPLFSEGEDGTPALDRAYAFLKWLIVDPRGLKDAELERTYLEWLAVERSA